MSLISAEHQYKPVPSIEVIDATSMEVIPTSTGPWDEGIQKAGTTTLQSISLDVSDSEAKPVITQQYQQITDLFVYDNNTFTEELPTGTYTDNDVFNVSDILEVTEYTLQPVVYTPVTATHKTDNVDILSPYYIEVTNVNPARHTTLPDSTTSTINNHQGTEEITGSGGGSLSNIQYWS